MLRKFTFIHAFVIIIGLLIAARLASVLVSPPGFFLDEAATGAHVIAMLHQGTNAHAEAWPLFSASLGGGYTTPIYLYPLTAWAALFGPSEISLRLFSQVSTIAAVLLLAFALKFWLSKRDVLIAAIIGLALPWGWLQGSLAWDPAFVPFFVALCFLGFSWLLYGTKKLYVAGSIVFPISLLSLAYLYPPCRITAPLLFIAGYSILYIKQRVSPRIIFITCLLSALFALPLLLFMLQPDALERSRQLSVFHEVGILEGIGRIGFNLLLLINPVFLFIAGDPNVRHATSVLGMLGTASIVPLAALVIYILRKKPKITIKNKGHLLLCVSLFGIVSALLGSALTSEGQPHSLRASAAWIFFAIILTLGWSILIDHFKARLLYIALPLFIISTLFYVGDLIVLYPERAADAFDVPSREQIYSGKPTPDYPGLSLEYYKNK